MTTAEGTRLARIEGKIDTLIEIRKDHELRIRAIELVVFQAKGGWKMIFLIFGVVASLLYFIADHVIKFIHK